MTKQEYKEALLSPRWQTKRARILKRDKYKCRKCPHTKYLQVHHKYYLEGKQPWEVPDSCLITLCSKCHKEAHKGKKISSFIRKKPPVLKRKSKKKKNKFGKLEKV